MTAETATAASETPPAVKQPLGSWGFIAFMLLCSALSYVDKQVISVLVEPMKASLKISDAQVGLVQGFAFSLCYAVAGLPLAFVIDRGNRARIAASCVAIWSIATGLCGLAPNFLTFLLARATTAISESGFSPSTVSMITDIFPRHRLARASAFYFLGPPLGQGAALLAGGFLLAHFDSTGGLNLPLAGHLEPWQAVFTALTIPGLILALLLLLLIREPGRRNVPRAAVSDTRTESKWGVVEIWRAKFLLPYMLGTIFVMTVVMSLGAWAPTYFVREFGVAPSSAGKMLGPIFMGASVLGSLISFTFAVGAKDANPTLRVIKVALLGSLLVGPFVIMMTHVSDMNLALVFYGLTAMSANVVASLATTPIQLTVPSAVRAQAITTGGFLLAVIGGGGGPFFVGLANDEIFGESGIGDSIMLVCGSAWAIGVALLILCWTIARRRAV